MCTVTKGGTVFKRRQMLHVKQKLFFTQLSLTLELLYLHSTWAFLAVSIIFVCENNKCDTAVVQIACLLAFSDDLNGVRQDFTPTHSNI